MRFPFPVTPEEAGGKTLISFVSAVPGAGSATLACLCALAFAGSREVALADFNPQSKVRAYMGLTPDVCPASVLDAAGVNSPEEIVRAGVNHTRGVFVLPGVSRDIDAAQVDSRTVLRAAVFLKKRFDLNVAVLDDLWRTGWVAAMVSDAVCLVLSPDRTSLDAYREKVEFLARLGCGGRLKIILNQAGAPGSLKEADVVQITKPDAVISFDPYLRAGCNRRYPESQKAQKAMKDLIKGGDAA